MFAALLETYEQWRLWQEEEAGARVVTVTWKRYRGKYSDGPP